MDISLLRLNFILFHDELFYICRAKQTVARFLVTGIIGRTCDYRYPGTDRASESDAAHLACESNRGTAATDLSAHVAKSNFYTCSRYSASLDELGFEQSELVTDGGQANYRIEIVEASEHGFRATATAVVDFDGDGVYNVWEIDQDRELKEIIKD